MARLLQRKVQLQMGAGGGGCTRCPLGCLQILNLCDGGTVKIVLSVSQCLLLYSKSIENKNGALFTKLWDIADVPKMPVS